VPGRVMDGCPSALSITRITEGEPREKVLEYQRRLCGDALVALVPVLAMAGCGSEAASTSSSPAAWRRRACPGRDARASSRSAGVLTLRKSADVAKGTSVTRTLE